jgi:TPR repeat protein
MYDNGDGVAKDLKMAVKLYTAAAEAGHRDASFKLGLMHDTGDGVA